MERCCEKQFGVYKRVERIMLETRGRDQEAGEPDRLFLEGAVCDGEAFGGCGRSCFYYWRGPGLNRWRGE